MILVTGATAESGFTETPYGVLKRFRTIERWLATNQRSLRILDFGCGTGELVTFPLAEAGHQVVGIDVHSPSIDVARSRCDLPNLEFKVATEADFLEYEQEFDAVICSQVLEHLENPSQLLAHFHRILRKDGQLIVTTPNGRGSYEILCVIERCLQRIGIHQFFRRLVAPRPTLQERTGFLNFDSKHIQFFKLRQLEKLFRAAGFEVLARRSGTLFCGPYVDLLFQWLPFRRSLIRLNAWLPDMLPMRLTADWMFLLRKT